MGRWSASCCPISDVVSSVRSATLPVRANSIGNLNEAIGSRLAKIEGFDEVNRTYNESKNEQCV